MNWRSSGGTELNFALHLLFLNYFAVCLISSTHTQTQSISHLQWGGDSHTNQHTAWQWQMGILARDATSNPPLQSTPQGFRHPWGAGVLISFISLISFVPRTWLSGRRGKTSLTVVWASSLPEMTQGKWLKHKSFTLSLMKSLRGPNLWGSHRHKVQQETHRFAAYTKVFKSPRIQKLQQKSDFGRATERTAICNQC